ncbi:MAG TPA: PHP domain-containing protein [Candidatus Nitrosopolaris sp.]|nr:PHP domain-containing protein [Candidatus Nitrosopolaris sp.]
MNLQEDYHVHSNYNDHSAPDLTIQNAVRRAEELKLKTLAFTEHIGRASDWVREYLREIESIGRDTLVRVISGFEAKILVDGSINCPEEYCDYFLIASFHTAYHDKGVWLNALTRTIENPSVDVIGHIAPEVTFRIEEGEIDDLASLIVKNKKIVEINAKYHRPPSRWIVLFRNKGVKFHLGSDAHRLEDIGQFTRISDLISLVVGNHPSY